MRRLCKKGGAEVAKKSDAEGREKEWCRGSERRVVQNVVLKDD